MKDWVYFYIEHTIKYGEPFYKEIGWSLGFEHDTKLTKEMMQWWAEHTDS